MTKQERYAALGLCREPYINFTHPADTSRENHTLRELLRTALDELDRRDELETAMIAELENAWRGRPTFELIQEANG